MEALLRDLIQQTSSTQSKLMLRRTETIVEKLVTNWMSVCLYGFLRVSCSCFSVFAVLWNVKENFSRPSLACVRGLLKALAASFFQKNLVLVRFLTQIVMSSAALCVWHHHRCLFKQLSSWFWFCAGKRRPALVPDGERSHTADSKGAGGLCNRESSVHAQRGLAAVPGAGLLLPGTSAHTLFKPYSVLHTWASKSNQEVSLSLHNWDK